MGLLIKTNNDVNVSPFDGLGLYYVFANSVKPSINVFNLKKNRGVHSVKQLICLKVVRDVPVCILLMEAFISIGTTLTETGSTIGPGVSRGGNPRPETSSSTPTPFQP